MQDMVNFIRANWNEIFIPIVVFIVSIIALFWLRKLFLDALIRWAKKTTWEADDILVPSLRWPILLLGLTLSIYLGLAVSNLPERWKDISLASLWTLLVAALMIAILSIGNTMIVSFQQRYKMPAKIGLVTRNVFRIVVLIIGVIAVMGIWGLPTSPLLLTFTVLLLV